MTPDAREYLRRHLLADEGLRLKPYKDTVGKLTIGVGRNLSDVGISAVEANILLDSDMERAWSDLVKRFPWVLRLTEARQAALTNLTFNLGIAGLAKFVNTMGAMQRGAYSTAANGLRRSLWYQQVQRTRSERIIRMVITGEFPEAQGD